MSTAPKAYYETIYATSAPIHHHSYLRPALLRLLKDCGLPPESRARILDVGCGNGSLSHWLFQQGYRVTGLDMSEQGIQTARRSFPEVTFLNGDVRELPVDVAEQKYDVVLATEVIEHLYSPVEFIRATSRCLAANGKLVLTTPYHGYFKNLSIALLGKMDRHFNPLWEGGHIKFFSEKSLRHLLEEEGLGQIHFAFAGRVPGLWKSMLCAASTPSEKR